jgi:hypothetical protein
MRLIYPFLTPHVSRFTPHPLTPYTRTNGCGGCAPSGIGARYS